MIARQHSSARPSAVFIKWDALSRPSAAAKELALLLELGLVDLALREAFLENVESGIAAAGAAVTKWIAYPRLWRILRVPKLLVTDDAQGV